MSKELEALERLKTAPTFMGGTTEYQSCTKSETLLLQDYDTVKQALLELQSIKEANHSEALECLECLYNVPDDYRSNDRAKDYETIKNYILKAQEPKKYLKWEDLEFSEELKVLNVRMNNNDYILRYALDIFGDKCCFLYDNTISHHIDLTRQFFNDLHLEVLE